MGKIYQSAGGTSGRLGSRQNPERGGMGRMRQGAPKLPQRRKDKAAEKGPGGLDFEASEAFGKNLKDIFGGKKS